MDLFYNIVLALYAFFLSFLMMYSFYTLNLALKFKKKFKSEVEDETKDFTYLNTFPHVTIQLPIFNEKYVIKRLLESVVALDYPKDKLEIQVLDDSTDDTRQIAEDLVQSYRKKGVDINHIHRIDRTGFKAGALRESLDQSKGEFIAIFDADFLPKADFLKKTISYFEDKQIGLVQTRWNHINEDYSAITKAQALALDGHFVVEQTARNLSGYFINFNGTAGIWRKETIYDAGNWQDDTITEDLDLSFRAQLKGWKFKYMTEYTTPSELPAEINALKSQQYRWTKGAIETAMKLLPSVWKSKIPFFTKVQCTYHLTNNVVYLAILGVALLNLPLIYVKTNVESYNEYFILMSIFSLSFVGPYLMFYFSQKGVYKDYKKRLLSFPLFMSGSMGMTLNNAKAVLDALMKKKTSFIRTPKFGLLNRGENWNKTRYRSRLNPVVIFEVFMTLYTLSALIIAIYHTEIAAIPFHFMFFAGFLTISVLTLKHYFSYHENVDLNG